MRRALLTVILHLMRSAESRLPLRGLPRRATKIDTYRKLLPDSAASRASSHMVSAS